MMCRMTGPCVHEMSADAPRTGEMAPLPRLVRPSWHEYFMRMAKVAASRGTCDRKQVGAIITRNNHILATGYNGAPSGSTNCIDDGHWLVDFADGSKSCVRTIHAEQNAIIQCAREGVSTIGATIYTTAAPCWECLKAIIQAGITNIVFSEVYNSARSKGIDIPEMAARYKIGWLQWTGD